MGNATQTHAFGHCPQHVLTAAVLRTCCTFGRWGLDEGSGPQGVGLEASSPAQLLVSLSLCSDVRSISYSSSIPATNSTHVLPAMVDCTLKL